MLTDLRIRAYMETAEASSFSGIKVESGNSYSIYWFVWERDGFYPWPDWEPIILIFCDSDLRFVCVRRHFIWKVYEAPDLAEPVTAFFEGRHHAPLIKTRTNARDFERKISRGTVPISLDAVLEEEVPDFARDPRHLVDRFKISAIPAALLHRISRQKAVDEKVSELLEDCRE